MPRRRFGGNRPPLSEQRGRGTLINPHDAEYQRIGKSNRFRTPDRMMTVGTRRRLNASDFGGDDFPSSSRLKRAARNRFARRRHGD